MLVTGVAGVYRDFGSKQASLLSRPGRSELESLQAAGQFPEGSMGPKVQAALEFASTTGNPAVICQPSELPEALAGRAGTTITGD